MSFFLAVCLGVFGQISFDICSTCAFLGKYHLIFVQLGHF